MGKVVEIPNRQSVALCAAVVGGEILSGTTITRHGNMAHLVLMVALADVLGRTAHSERELDAWVREISSSVKDLAKAGLEHRT